MLIKKPDEIRSSEITDESVYLRRREFLAGGAAAAVGAAGLWLPGQAQAGIFDWFSSDKPAAQAGKGTGRKLEGVIKTPYTVDDPLNSWKDITTYNNFYEFGTGKDDPVRNAQKFEPRPWSVEIAGECEKPGTVNLEDLIAPHKLEERVYRFRCVEAWSMVIPWVGVSLADMLKAFKPTSKAKYVAFQTLHDPKRMPGQKRAVIPWPYIEGLRIDEAMHPLSMMVVGLYGHELPNQNGAPLRLMVPWKYGFKNIKSIVKISFMEHMPRNTWNIAAPNEYGFYANVNPAVDHPRWSQKRERRIGELGKRKTLPFNGYEKEVAGLYKGMNLTKFF